MDAIIEVLKSVLPEIISAVVGFIAGGFTMHLHYKKKITQNISANSQKGNNVASGNGIAAGNIGTVNITNKPADTEKIPELSAQAKSILRQLVQSGDVQLVTFAPTGVVEGVQTTKNKGLSFSDQLSVDDDLDLLEKYHYLKFCQRCNAGRIFSLTSEGKKFVDSLSE